MLLFFDIGFAIWWAVRRGHVPRRQSRNEPPSYRAVAAFILILAFASYLICIIMQLGRSVLGFLTLSCLLQYLSFFMVATIAVRRNWFWNIQRSTGGRALFWHWSRRSFSFPFRSPEA